MLINSKFQPAWWLRNSHAQTLWAAKVMRFPTPATVRERLTTPDNDFVDIDWCDEPAGGSQQPETTRSGNDSAAQQDIPIDTALNQPIVVIFHGLTGSSNSPYVRALMSGLKRIGCRSVCMNFRGCSGEPNLKSESYHSGHTKDISFVIDTINHRFPHAPIAATGYSLGGNALLKYLATSADNPLSHAISISPPLQLAEGARRMETGLSRMYGSRLVRQMKDALDDKHQRYPTLGVDELNYKDVKTLREFDIAATVPVHGFDSVDQYYEKASTLHDLPAIQTNTHILFAQDDPFFTQACIPAPDAMSDKVTFELTSHGGHVAFVEGFLPLLGNSWLTSQVCALHDMKFASKIW